MTGVPTMSVRTLAVVALMALAACKYDDAGSSPDVLITSITHIPACDTEPTVPCDANTNFDDQVSHLDVSLIPPVPTVSPTVIFGKNHLNNIELINVPAGHYTLHIDAVANNKFVAATAEKEIDAPDPAVSIDFKDNVPDGGSAAAQ